MCRHINGLDSIKDWACKQSAALRKKYYRVNPAMPDGCSELRLPLGKNFLTHLATT
jgi:hypothetical protein